MHVSVTLDQTDSTTSPPVLNISRSPGSSRAVRWYLVQRVRAQLATGRYDSAYKLDVAAQRLLEDLCRDGKA